MTNFMIGGNLSVEDLDRLCPPGIEKEWGYHNLDDEQSYFKFHNSGKWLKNSIDLCAAQCIYSYTAQSYKIIDLNAIRSIMGYINIDPFKWKDICS